MNNDDLYKLLDGVKNKKISVEQAIEHFRDMPFKDLDFVKLDSHRDLRKSLGEVIYCENKTIMQLEIISKELLKMKKDKIIYTRVNKEKAKLLLSIDKELEYNENAGMVYKKSNKVQSQSIILVVTAGTSDIPVAEEAACTAEVTGCKVERHFDVGVAGIHRLFSIYDRLQKASVIVVAAGMEGALPSVISGLVDVPIIAVPTSVGYGASFNGIAPLLTMLNSCSPGIAVVNIDNGFGAGYLASLIIKGNK